MDKRHADYDDAQVTPAESDPAVGRVGGVEDESFAREDGAEVRANAEREGAAQASGGTTHASGGAGHPRMILSVNDASADLAPGSPERELALNTDSTAFGSGAAADVTLAGLAALHAEVLRDERDEYRIFDRSGGGTTVDGAIADGTLLHTGDRVSMGEWTMSFYREEFADHGRPFGGRQGGELAVDDPQPEPVIDTDAPLASDTRTEA